MLTQIINAKILTPQGWLKDGSVIIRDNKILEVTNCDLAVIGAEVVDAKGMYVVPGGVEIHIHGGGGCDFMEDTEEAFRGAIKAHMKHGTTSIFPTLSSSTVPMIEAAAETCTKLMAEPNSRHHPSVGGDKTVERQAVDEIAHRADGADICQQCAVVRLRLQPSVGGAGLIPAVQRRGGLVHRQL